MYSGNALFNRINTVIEFWKQYCDTREWEGLNIGFYYGIINDKFEILVEYQAAPSFEGKNLILIDPMLATGQSLVAVLHKLHLEHQPKEIHIAVVIATPEGIQYLEENVPENCHLWVAALDEKLNEHNYIVPGLGDAGDLAYGIKL